MAPRNTYCTGYYQHKCGVLLTAANRHGAVGGRCIACGTVYGLGTYYKGKGLPVPERIHARTAAIAAAVAAGTYEPPLPKPAKRSESEIINAQRPPLLTVKGPWQCGAFSLTDIDGGVVLRLGDGDECVGTVVEGKDLLKLAAWAVAACLRKKLAIGRVVEWLRSGNSPRGPRAQGRTRTGTDG